MKNLAALQFLTQTSVLGTYYHTPSKALKYFVLPIHPLNGTHTQSMSQGLEIFLQPVSSPSSTLIEVDLTSDINKGS